MIWGFLREIFKWHNHPTSMKKLSEMWLMGKGPLPVNLILYTFTGFAWALWNNRNKMAIEHKYPKTPSDIIYVALSYMEKWRVLLKEDDRQQIAQVKDEMDGVQA
jgi:membrane protein required for beta-lactamase induction